MDYDETYDDGYVDGWDEGREEGYDEGYDDGRTDSDARIDELEQAIKDIKGLAWLAAVEDWQNADDLRGALQSILEKIEQEAGL